MTRSPGGRGAEEGTHVLGSRAARDAAGAGGGTAPTEARPRGEPVPDRAPVVGVVVVGGAAGGAAGEGVRADTGAAGAETAEGVGVAGADVVGAAEVGAGAAAGPTATPTAGAALGVGADNTTGGGALAEAPPPAMRGGTTNTTVAVQRETIPDATEDMLSLTVCQSRKVPLAGLEEPE